MQLVKIPAERVAVLLGTKKETKKMLEKAAGVKLHLSEEGDVEITSVDSVNEWKAVDIIRAIGRGFLPEKALKLLSDGVYLKIINLKEIFDSRKAIERYRGRVIGEKGKSRMTIEELSGAEICIYGNTISIIGDLEEAYLAEAAIKKLLDGSNHATVYSFLERGRRKMREAKYTLWERCETLPSGKRGTKSTRNIELEGELNG